MRRHIRTIVFGALALIWLVFVFHLAAMSGADSGRMSLWVTRHLMGWLTRLGVPAARLHHVTRKLAHFGVFAVEGFLVAGTLLGLMKALPSVLLTAVLCALFAIANEYAQTFAAGRACSPVDMLIDFGGSVLGLIAMLAIHAIVHSLKNHRTKE